MNCRKNILELLLIKLNKTSFFCLPEQIARPNLPNSVLNVISSNFSGLLSSSSPYKLYFLYFAINLP